MYISGKKSELAYKIGKNPPLVDWPCLMLTSR